MDAITKPTVLANCAPGSARDTLARNIRTLRAGKGWSQEALALEAGLHRTFVAHVERAARNISLDNIARLAVALEVTAPDLLQVPPRDAEIVNPAA